MVLPCLHACILGLRGPTWGTRGRQLRHLHLYNLGFGVEDEVVSTFRFASAEETSA